MSYIIFILLSILSLVAILFWVVRKISPLTALPAEPATVLPGQSSFFKKIFDKARELRYIKRISFSTWSVKIMQKIKVLILKTDNFFTRRMQKMKEQSHTFNIRAKAWLVKKHIEDVQEKAQIATLIKDKQNTKDEAIKKEELIKVETDREQELIDRISHDLKNVSLYSELVELYLSKGNLEDAKAALKQILKLEPSNQEARKKIESIIDEEE